MEDRINYPSSEVTNLLTSIEKLKLERIENQEFVEQDVYLDGREYVNCKFRHCRVFVKLGRFVANGCKFETCHFEFNGPAQNIAGVMQGLIGQQQKGAG